MLRPSSHPVACCCTKFKTGQTFGHVQTYATTPDIVGPTMLGVVACVCSYCARVYKMISAVGKSANLKEDVCMGRVFCLRRAVDQTLKKKLHVREIIYIERKI